MKELFVSHSPVINTFKGDGAGKIILGRWRKSVKDKKSIGGKIFANVFGDSKQEAEKNALIVSKIPEMIKALEYIATWDSYKDHPIGKTATRVLIEINL